MDFGYDFVQLEKRIAEVEEWLKKEISVLRTGRANPSLIENIEIECYGAKTPMKHIAAINVEDARTLRIEPWDQSLVPEIEKGIRASELGIEPVVDKKAVRIILPQLTEERRKGLLKLLGEKLERAKISLRQERDEVWSDIQAKERRGEITEDDKYRLKDELQKIIDKAHEELEKISEQKKKEIQS